MVISAHALTHHLNRSWALTNWQPTQNLLQTFTRAECDACGYRYQRRKFPLINSHSDSLINKQHAIETVSLDTPQLSRRGDSRGFQPKPLIT